MTERPELGFIGTNILNPWELRHVACESFLQLYEHNGYEQLKNSLAAVLHEEKQYGESKDRYYEWVHWAAAAHLMAFSTVLIILTQSVFFLCVCFFALEITLIVMRDLQLIYKLKNSSTNTGLRLQNAKTNRRLRRHTNHLGPGVVPECRLPDFEKKSGPTWLGNKFNDGTINISKATLGAGPWQQSLPILCTPRECWIPSWQASNLGRKGYPTTHEWVIKPRKSTDTY